VPLLLHHKKKKRITIVMDSFVNNIVNVAAIEEPSQNAKAEGTYTECESGVDEQVSVLQSPIRPPTHAKSKSRKRCSNNTEAEGTDTMCFSSIEEPIHPPAHEKSKTSQSEMETEGMNRPTCVVDAVCGIIPDNLIFLNSGGRSIIVAGSPIRPTAHTAPANSTSRKKKRCKISQHLRANDSESKTKKGGSRLVRNKSDMETEGTNRRTCLVDAICAVIPTNEVKNSVRRSIIIEMPSQGDTSISHANNALASHGMVLNRASKRYMREGGAPFHLLQERKCRLVIQIKLTNHDNQKMSHFVSWDGHTIHDSPYNSMVNNTFDRASKKGSDNVFGKMYRRDFKNWQITNVYDLLDLIHE